MYEFSNSLQRGEALESQLDAHFQRRYGARIVKTDMQGQRLGIDRFITWGSGRRDSVEYKCDEILQRTGNVFIETVSVDTSGARGWAYTSTAQILVYYDVGNSIAYCTSMMKVKNSVAEWQQQYDVRCVQNRGYQTQGICVPLEVFIRDCEVSIEQIQTAEQAA